jgi:hypothetical protein
VDVDWGDGAAKSFNSTPSAISHAYGSAGRILVVVTGLRFAWRHATASQSVTVTPRSQPTCQISARQQSVGRSDGTFTIHGDADQTATTITSCSSISATASP